MSLVKKYHRLCDTNYRLNKRIRYLSSKHDEFMDLFWVSMPDELKDSIPLQALSDYIMRGDNCKYVDDGQIMNIPIPFKKDIM